MIKVAMILRSTAFTAKGGDTVQAQQTAAALKPFGVDADIVLADEKIRYKEYDLLHFFNITRPADILYHTKKASLPFVISPVFIDYSEYDKFHRGGFSGKLFRLFSSDGIEYIKTVARRFSKGDAILSTRFLVRGQKGSIHEIISKAGMLLPNSDSESDRFKKSYADNATHAVIPNGVDAALFRSDENIQRNETLVICAARIEGIKNQLNLIKALNNTGYQLILIGAAAPNQSAYYKKCRDTAAANISFVDHLSQQELLRYYQNAKVHVLPSWFETTGLSSLEAAVAGCNVVISDRGDAKEYFDGYATYCDPSSPESILDAIQKAAASTANDELRKKIIDSYTWEIAAERTAAVYKKILNISCS